MKSNGHGIELLRHTLATLAYRFQKAVTDSPPGFEHFQAGNGVRNPLEIVRHMTHDLLYVIMQLNEGRVERIPTPDPIDWQGEISRFHNTLARIDALLLSFKRDSLADLKLLLQGPLSDVMTHIGQIAMIRRLAGSPVKGESFMRARIITGGVSDKQDVQD